MQVLHMNQSRESSRGDSGRVSLVQTLLVYGLMVMWLSSTLLLTATSRK